MKPSKLFVIFILVFLFSFLSRSYQHAILKTTFFDQYAFDHTLWSATRSGLLLPALGRCLFVTGHFSPILFLYSLPYFICPAPFWIFAIQALFVAGIVALIFNFAQKRLNAPEADLILFLLMVSVPLRYMALNDFHQDIVVSFLLTAALYLLFTGKKILFPLLLFFSGFLVKETSGLVIASFGLFIIFFRREKLLGLIALVVGIAGTAVLIQEIIPRFNSIGIYQFSNYYSHFGRNTYEQMLNMLSHPFQTLGVVLSAQNIFYVFLLIAPLGFLPIFYPSLLLTGLFPLAENLLSNYRFQKDITTQYQYVLIPVFFFAAILGIKSLTENNRWQGVLRFVRPTIRFFAVLSVIAFFLLQLRLYIPSVNLVSAYKIMGAVPKDASVSASEHLILHLQYRHDISLFPKTDRAEYVIFEDYDRSLPPGDDYQKMKTLWEGKKFGRILNYIFMGIASPGKEYIQAVEEIKHKKNYTLIKNENGIFLYKKRTL